MFSKKGMPPPKHELPTPSFFFVRQGVVLKDILFAILLCCLSCSHYCCNGIQLAYFTFSSNVKDSHGNILLETDDRLAI